MTFEKIGEEVICGGVSASFACIFTNPLEVIKTRLQLQGELKGAGAYKIHYKNFFHAFYVVAKSDGLVALQSGLVSGLWYQLIMNGIRLGSYQLLSTSKLHHSEGTVSFVRSVVMGAACGALGSFIGSPLYLVKTHMQAKSNSNIAVGFQRETTSTLRALRSIYAENGIRSLWRGWQAQVTRVMVGSAGQLSAFSTVKSWLHQYNVCDIQSMSNTLLACCVSAFAVTSAIAPFDNLSTRIYNQPLDEFGKGKYYSGLLDAGFKVASIEGFFGLYKGATAVFMRLAPHTIITLFLWDRFRQFYHRFRDRNEAGFSTG